MTLSQQKANIYSTLWLIQTFWETNLDWIARSLWKAEREAIDII